MYCCWAASRTAVAGASDALNRLGRIFANPSSGPRSISIEDLLSAFPNHEIERTDPDELTARIEAVLGTATPSSFVGIAGGDGTVQAAADTIARSKSDVPLLVIPAGTRNHFANDLGIGDVSAAANAAVGPVRSVDLAWANDTWFVNNSSIGTYPHLVVEREGREHRLPKRFASVVAAWHQLRRGRRITVDIDGVTRHVWAVFIGNNCYGDTLRDLTGRQRLDEGVLDLRIARADGRLSRLRIAGAVLFGRVARSPLIERRAVASVAIDCGDSTEVAIDGEVRTMESPLHYRSCPNALRVLVPAGEDAEED